VSVLQLKDVGVRLRKGHRELVVLRGVSLEIVAGEVVCITGARHSGRTTLLRVAAGVEPPDEGTVRFAGADLRAASPERRRQLVLGNTRFISQLGRDVLEQVMAPLMAMGIPRDEASLQAHRALERVGVADVELQAPAELVPVEAARVMLARAIVREPRLLILDEPTNGIDALDRAPLLSLIQSLAHESGTAVLLTAGETTSVAGADRILRLSEGELLGRVTPAEGDVVPIRRATEPPA
jgi:ABC-type lipoprotein export system ATPase subunit